MDVIALMGFRHDGPGAESPGEMIWVEWFFHRVARAEQGWGVAAIGSEASGCRVHDMHERHADGGFKRRGDLVHCVGGQKDEACPCLFEAFA